MQDVVVNAGCHPPPILHVRPVRTPTLTHSPIHQPTNRHHADTHLLPHAPFRHCWLPPSPPPPPGYRSAKDSFMLWSVMDFVAGLCHDTSTRTWHGSFKELLLAGLAGRSSCGFLSDYVRVVPRLQLVLDLLGSALVPRAGPFPAILDCLDGNRPLEYSSSVLARLESCSGASAGARTTQ